MSRCSPGQPEYTEHMQGRPGCEPCFCHLFSHFNLGCIRKTKKGVHRGTARDPKGAEAAVSHPAVQRWPAGHDGENAGLRQGGGILALPEWSDQ